MKYPMSNGIQQVVHPELWHRNRHHRNKVRIHNIVTLGFRAENILAIRERGGDGCWLEGKG